CPDGQVACRSFSGGGVGLPGSAKPWRLRYALCKINDVSSSERGWTRTSPGEQTMTQVQPQRVEPERPPLSDVTERNIQNQVRTRVEAISQRGFQERMADAITAFSGNMSFLYLHALWFGLWVFVNIGWFGIHPFDPFPYSLLTMIVSLEAIFL